MNILQWYLVLVLINKLGHAVNADWSGCVDPSFPDKKVRRDDDTTVCLTLGPSADWSPGIDSERYTMKFIADEYSRFRIKGSYSNLAYGSRFEDNNISLFVSSQSSLSFLRMYYDRQNGYIFPYLTAIIDVKDGVVQGIAWDDSSIFCGGERAQENTYSFDGSATVSSGPTKGCYLLRDECNEAVLEDSNACDLMLHVVWTGTDVNGKVLTSSKKRYSAFQTKLVQDYMADALSKIPSFDDWDWPFFRK